MFVNKRTRLKSLDVNENLKDGQNSINERIKLPFVGFIFFFFFFYVSKAKYLGKLEGMGPKKVMFNVCYKAAVKFFVYIY